MKGKSILCIARERRGVPKILSNKRFIRSCLYIWHLTDLMQVPKNFFEIISGRP